MYQRTYTITFDNVSEAEAGRCATELRNFLLDAAPDIKVERKREDPYTQDFGATLLLILGTPALVAVVNRIGDWLALRYKAGITIKNGNGEIIATNITSKDVIKLAELLSTQKCE
jgi:hypothetical protein